MDVGTQRQHEEGLREEVKGEGLSYSTEGQQALDQSSTLAIHASASVIEHYQILMVDQFFTGHHLVSLHLCGKVQGQL